MADFTKIAKSRLGGMRFGKYEKFEKAVKNDVTTYTMSKEEIDRLYPKVGKEIKRVELTKELYLQHKSEGMSNRDISRKYNVSDGNFYYYLKKWGLRKEQEVKPKVEVKLQEGTPVIKNIETAKEEVILPPQIEEVLRDKTLRDGVPIKHDVINRPSHYTAGGIEVIDYMQAKMTKEQFEGYLLGNVFKYTSRFQFKNGLEDLKKAQWYISKLIEVTECTV